MQFKLQDHDYMFFELDSLKFSEIVPDTGDPWHSPECDHAHFCHDVQLCTTCRATFVAQSWLSEDWYVLLIFIRSAFSARQPVTHFPVTQSGLVSFARDVNWHCSHNIHHYQPLNLNSKLISFHSPSHICKVTEVLLHYTLKILT